MDEPEGENIALTTEKAKKIKAINKDAVHKICSGQVVLSLAIAVKELVENSLDAGATNVEIRLKEYGQELVEVVDNGSGVDKDNFAGLTLKYHTSKISDFSDLLGVSTFGFRGEALSSLCSLSDVTITTRHTSTELGTKIIYDHKGHIKSMNPCARQKGTTVSLANLFSTLPVRQKEFHRNIKREFNKMTQLLYAYCLISEGKKIVCTNQTSKGTKTVVVATQGGTIRDNISAVFGVRQLQSLMELKPNFVMGNIKDKIFTELEREIDHPEPSQELDMDVSDNELELSEESSNDATSSDKKSQSCESSQKSSASDLDQLRSNHKQPFDFNGFVSTCAHGSGRSTTDRQFFYINSRPCEPQKVIKAINEVYKQYNQHQYPFVFINVQVKHSAVDVNVTPDKRKIFLDKEKNLLELLKLSMNKIYAHIPATVKMENITESLSQKSNCSQETAVESAPRIFSSFLSQFKKQSQPNHPESSCSSESKKKTQTLDSFISSKIIKADSEPSSDESPTKPPNPIITIVNDQNCNVELEDIITEVEPTKEVILLDYSEKIVTPSQIITVDEYLNEKEDIQPPKKSKQPLPTPDEVHEESEPKRKKVAASNNEIINRKVCSVNITLDNIKTLLTEDTRNREAKRDLMRVKFRSAINPVLNKKCEEELQKEISKDMFNQMKIIGQFNLGFIIAQHEDDLFIIDQHATDEKYNFETLQKTTVLSNQALVVPQNLELTSINERILIDNLDVCKKNGFTFEIDEDAPPTKRVKLLTVPISKNLVFGKDDIEELLFLLKDGPSEMCRPSRVLSMFASRACRKSVMIGTALSKSTMRKLIDHMALLDHPWNCPHGRPTIRHLINLALAESK